MERLYSSDHIVDFSYEYGQRQTQLPDGKIVMSVSAPNWEDFKGQLTTIPRSSPGDIIMSPPLITSTDMLNPSAIFASLRLHQREEQIIQCTVSHPEVHFICGTPVIDRRTNKYRSGVVGFMDGRETVRADAGEIVLVEPTIAVAMDIRMKDIPALDDKVTTLLVGTCSSESLIISPIKHIGAVFNRHPQLQTIIMTDRKIDESTEGLCNFIAYRSK